MACRRDACARKLEARVPLKLYCWALALLGAYDPLMVHFTDCPALWPGTPTAWLPLRWWVRPVTPHSPLGSSMDVKVYVKVTETVLLGSLAVPVTEAAAESEDGFGQVHAGYTIILRADVVIHS